MGQECIDDQLFCLQYELRLLAGQVIGAGLERWIDGFTPPHVAQEHMQRYVYAGKLAEGREVLDIACGTGRGSRIMAESGAAAVIGYDIEPDAVRYAGARNKHSKVSFRVGDALQLAHNEDFDLAVCFETVEHLPTPDIFLRGLAQSLRRNGVLVISTPISSMDVNRNPSNPHHVQEWGCNAFRKLVEVNFMVRKIHIQYWPVYIPSFGNRVFTKIRDKLRLAQAYRRKQPSELQWDEYSPHAFPGPPTGLSSAAYQILECVRR